MVRNSVVSFGKTNSKVIEKFNEYVDIFGGNYNSTLLYLLKTKSFSSNQYLKSNTQLINFTSTKYWTIPVKKVLLEEVLKELDLYKDDFRLISRAAAIEQLILGTGFTLENKKLNYETDKIYNQFLPKINEQRKNNKYCDVTLVLDGAMFSAHKFVLSAISEYFQELFEKNSANVVEIKTVNARDFEEILNFIYAGKITIDKENFETITKLTEKFKLQKLKEICQIFEYFTELLENKTDEDIANNTNEDQIVIKRSSQVPIIPFTRNTERKAKRDAYVTISQALTNINEFDMPSPSSFINNDNIPNTEGSVEQDDLDLATLPINNTSLSLPLKKRTNENFNSNEVGSKLICSICNITFTQNIAYRIHLLSHESVVVSNKCDICGEEKFNINELREHMTLEHSTELPTISGHFICEVCNRTFKSTHHLSVHMKTHFPSVAKQLKPHSCRVCGKEFKSRSHLTRHMISHTGKRTHCCTTCGKLFLKADHLKRHERIHTSERPFTCEECGKTFRDKDHLKRHHLTHTEERPYFCEVCGKQFKDKSTLSSHQKSHTNASMACPICGKMFKTRERLDVHTTKHATVKPHVCEVCGKKFPFNGRLRKHMLSHTGDRPYHCETCGKQFRDSHSLRLHQKTHTGIGLHPCPDCGKKFTNAFHLKRHARVHTGEKPFQCDVCHKSFGRNDNFEVHRRNCAVSYQLKKNLSDDFTNWNSEKPVEKTPSTNSKIAVLNLNEDISINDGNTENNFDRFRQIMPEQMTSFSSLLTGTYNNNKSDPIPMQRRIVPLLLQNTFSDPYNPPQPLNYQPIELLPHRGANEHNQPMQSGVSGQILYENEVTRCLIENKNEI